MISFLKHKIFLILNHIHFKLFSQPIGQEMQKFIQNIGLVGAGTIISVLLLFIVNTFASKLLGPTEYGRYSLVISLGQIFIIPMTMGLNTPTVNYISSSKNQKEKKLFARNAMLLSTASIITISIIYTIFNSYISHFFKIDGLLFAFTCLYSISLAFKYMFEAILKGYSYFKLISIFEILNSTTIFTLFFIYIFTSNKLTFLTYLIPTVIGSLLYSILSFTKNINKFFPLKIDRNTTKKLADYTKFTILGSIAGIALNNIDKLIINKFMTLSDVGTYSIYLSSSTFIGGYLLQIFTQVFFPMVSAIKERKSITVKIIKLMILTAIPIVIFNIFSTSFVLFLAGNQYPRIPIYILLFSILSTITIFSNILWWFLNSYGKSGAKFASILGILFGALNLIIMLYLTKHFHIYGVLSSLIITNLLMITFAIQKIKLNNF